MTRDRLMGIRGFIQPVRARSPGPETNKDNVYYIVSSMSSSGRCKYIYDCLNVWLSTFLRISATGLHYSLK